MVTFSIQITNKMSHLVDAKRHNASIFKLIVVVFSAVFFFFQIAIIVNDLVLFLPFEQ